MAIKLPFHGPTIDPSKITHASSLDGQLDGLKIKNSLNSLENASKGLVDQNWILQDQVEEAPTSLYKIMW